MASLNDLVAAENDCKRLEAENEQLTRRLALAEAERDALEKSHADLGRRLAEAGRENERLQAALDRTPTPEAILLQARRPDGGAWVNIFPAQLAWMAKEGCDVRALDGAVQHPLPTAYCPRCGALMVGTVTGPVAQSASTIGVLK